jgi:signal transduction histidine kinase
MRAMIEYGAGSRRDSSRGAIARAATVALLVAGVALGVVAYSVQVDDLFSPEERAFAIVLVAWSFLFSGVVVSLKRPASRFGPLMIVAGFALLARQLRYAHEALLFSVFLVVGDLAYAVVGHVILAYPSGRVTDRAGRLLVRAGYAAALLFPLAILLVYDASRPLLGFDPTPRDSLLLAVGSADAVWWLQRAFVVVFYGILVTALIVLLVRRFVRAAPHGRRILLPLLVAAVAVGLRALFEVVFTFVDRPFAYDYLFWWQVAGFLALPVALAIGLVRSRLARANIGELVLELRHASPDRLEGALARALADPTLRLGLWLPERREYVNGDGSSVLPTADPTRAVTFLHDDDGQPLAAVVHDPELVHDPALVEAAGAAAMLALENARLHAEVKAQLQHVRASRGRIAAAADDERRRIERDIHDGAQQRLVALALELSRARRGLDPAATEDVERVLAAAAQEVQAAVTELRELAHGVHPSILVEDGLAAALASLADRTPLRVTVVAPPDRMPPEVESAGYFVVCEALANVAKHAGAEAVAITVTLRDDELSIEVVDDGVGGADVRDGTGLRGLADRVEALGGRLRVESPAGVGTRLMAELPMRAPQVAASRSGHRW